MKIDFNASTNTIQIKDGLKAQYLLIRILLIFTVVNSVLFPLFVLDAQQLEWLNFIWVLLGMTALTVLIYQIVKKSPAEELHLSQISSLCEKQRFGQKRLRLQLKNGKTRDLTEVRSDAERRELKGFFEKLGVELNQSS